MILLLILTLIVLLLITFVVLIISGVGAIGIILCGDIIVCIAIIVWIIRKFTKKKK